MEKPAGLYSFDFSKAKPISEEDFIKRAEQLEREQPMMYYGLGDFIRRVILKKDNGHGKKTKGEEGGE